ncbi:uncharacterized protein LOC141776587 [Sebastes fasciatus]|uniref:uncharacterized protein LOC141776587 n=1 Tax=Sebastes fasciatus TaxID=394691 RepID=UPI003D9EB906
MLSLDCYGLSLLFVTVLTGVSCEELTPVKNEEPSLEDSTVTLSYTYSELKPTGSDYFFWYRQYPGKPPEFIVSQTLKTIAVGRAPQLNMNSFMLAVKSCCVLFSVHSQPVKVMQLFLVWMMMFTFHPGSSEDLVKPFKDVMPALEGDNVTLSCSYSGSVQNLYWYQHKSSSSPQLLITEYSEDTAGLSFTHDKNTKKFHLIISSAAVSDSAVYYCALQPTVTGNT